MNILWFRRDLRVDDNKLLSLKLDDVLPIFIFDKNILNSLDKDDKRVSFIFEKVIELKVNLKSLGLDLAIFFGYPKDIFLYLKSLGATKVFASIDYDEHAINRDKTISEILEFEKLNDCYIFEPNELLKDDGSFYKIYTPFSKKAISVLENSHYIQYKTNSFKLKNFNFNQILSINGDIKYLNLELNSIGFIKQHLNIKPPKELLNDFKEKITNYEIDRDFPSKIGTSNLSIHIRFGTISIRHILREIRDWNVNFGLNIMKFLQELLWREFFAYILYFNPNLQNINFLNISPKWLDNEEHFIKWCNGETGVPIVDAGMRELNSSGLMHNRVRMIVASFLTKDLHINWQKGEEYFAKKLLDYDASSNILSWQWCSSVGVDAQPYFRVFNPYLQAQKFDCDGVYIKKHIKELEKTPSKLLFDENYLLKYKIANYPQPIVNHKIESKRAIEFFKL